MPDLSCIPTQSADIAHQTDCIPGMCPYYSALQQLNLGNIRQTGTIPGKLHTPMPATYPRHHMKRQSYQECCDGASRLLEHPSSSLSISSSKDGRIPKDIMYGEMAAGHCPVGRPTLRFKDACKRDLKRVENS